MKYFFTLPFLLILSYQAFPQIRGTVQDSQAKPLPGAAVVLWQADSLVGGTSSDAEGNFSLQAPSGAYRLEVSFISFQKFTQNIKHLQGQSLNLGPIRLEPAAAALEEVTVEAQAQVMEFRQDKRIFNVSKDITNAGSNASDILNNLPSVTVDVEGAVSLRGSQNVRILVNGKISGLIGNDPANALRSIPAELIERIEVITNPSARYDAEGDAGIINIVLKKQQEAGINGSFNAELGWPDLAGAGAALNYRKNKLNFFTNLNFRYNRAPGSGFSDQNFTFPDTSYSFLRDRQQSRGGYRATLRGGADYNLNSRDMLTGSFLFRPSVDNNLVDIRYQDFNSDGELTQVVNRNEDEQEREQTLEGSLTWQRQYEDFKDHKWTTNFTYTSEKDGEESVIEQDTNGLSRIFEQQVDNQEDQRSILLQSDYVHPFSEKTGFETGFRATLREIDNTFNLNDVDESGALLPVEEFTNAFTFVENVYAAYGIYNGQWDSAFTYQLGLRAELTDITTTLQGEDPNQRSFYNLFPSAFITYKINPLNDVQVSYSRRINRPGFWELAPFFGFSDNRNFFSGNPDVNPEFTDSYEAGYVRYFPKGSLYAGLYYRHRKGVIERIRTVDDDGFTRIFPVNLSTENNSGLELNFQYRLASWYSINGNVNLFYSITDGEFEGQSFDASTLASSGRMSQRLSFWESDLQLSFNFRGPRRTPQGSRLGIYTMDAAWSKEILKNKATLTLAVRDMFNTRLRRSRTFGDNFSSVGRFQWQRGQYTLSFTYRLKNQGKSQRRSSGGPSESAPEF